MSINAPLWMHAMETQLNAHETIRAIFRNDRTGMAAEHGFEVDRVLLPHAVPFAWSRDSVEAAWAASAGVPDDTILNRWNLETDVVWWYFETPLPVQTLELNELGLHDAEGAIGVRALCFGWVTINGQLNLAVSAWCDAHGKMGPRVLLTPSQTWCWTRDTTLAANVAKAAEQHRRLYGVGGKWHMRPQVGAEKFIAATDKLSRFILAGLAWLDQKILVKETGTVERHRRKAFNRAMAHDIDAVQVIKLRKTEYTKHENDGEHAPVEWSCRWIVAGHWKNQPCGPGHADRKLIHIMAYPKGPEDKPFKQPSARRVFDVGR